MRVEGLRKSFGDLVAVNRTIIFTTHNMDEAERVVDRVAIIDHGKLLELDTPEALAQRVGKGDTLDLGLACAGGDRLAERDLALIGDLFPAAKTGPNGLVLRQLGIVDALPAILDRIKQAGLSVTRMEIRESTLENVFLTLTGRSLRE